MTASAVAGRVFPMTSAPPTGTAPTRTSRRPSGAASKSVIASSAWARWRRCAEDAVGAIRIGDPDVVLSLLLSKPDPGADRVSGFVAEEDVVQIFLAPILRR